MELLRLEPHDTGYNVLHSNLYALQNKWNDVKLRTSMKYIGIRKVPGISSMEQNGSVHEFVTGNESHPEIKRIHEMVDEMQRKLKLAGHVSMLLTHHWCYCMCMRKRRRMHLIITARSWLWHLVSLAQLWAPHSEL